MVTVDYIYIYIYATPCYNDGALTVLAVLVLCSFWEHRCRKLCVERSSEERRGAEQPESAHHV